MSNKLAAIRNKAALAQSKNVEQIEKPVTLYHGHDNLYAYLRIVPANELCKFTEEQYVSLIGEMNKVLASLRESKNGTK